MELNAFEAPKNCKLLSIADLTFEFAGEPDPEQRKLCELCLHGDPELVWVREGHLIAMVEGNRIDLNPGDLLMINPFESHQLLLAQNARRYLAKSVLLHLNPLMQLPIKQLNDVLSLLHTETKGFRHRYPTEEFPSLSPLLHDLTEHAEQGNEMLLLSELLRLFSCLGSPDQPPVNRDRQRSERFVQETLDYIHSIPPAQITLESVALRFNYNKNYFSTLFCRYFGTPFTEFCVKYKIELAQGLIQRGYSNLSEICQTVGFNHYTYFFRSFKRTVGISPGEYVRQLHIAQDLRRIDGAPSIDIKTFKKETPIMKIRSRILSALVKVFENEDPPSEPESRTLTALRGDRVSFQIAYLADEKCEATVKLDSPLSDFISLRTVEYVTAGMIGYPEQIEEDRNYLRKTGGKFPDPLREVKDGKLSLRKHKYRTLWLEVKLPRDVEPGDYSIAVSLVSADGTLLCEDRQKLTVLPAELPPQELIHTEWFHADCLADYYGTQAFDEKHWRLIENFMRAAVDRGVNMIYTPIFTPPMDTAETAERTTVQLVKIFRDGGEYRFDFTLLDRYVKLALDCGYQWFEMSHFLGGNETGYHAVKIMAEVDGVSCKLFDHNAADPHNRLDGEDYPHFLSVFIPALRAELRRLGVEQQCYFHLHDEPRTAQYEVYKHAKELIGPLLDGVKVMDALCRVRYYNDGLVPCPVANIAYLPDFDAVEIPERWTYYCCSEGVGFTNRFLAMRLARTRAIGILLYKYRIDGFLHWGYNFYNSCGSLRHINPYQTPDSVNPGNEAFAGFPAGDAFAVYPGADGHPEDSVRWLAIESGLNDLRLCRALEKLTSREYVLSLIEGDLSQPITTTEFPTSDYYYINLRNRLNREFANRC